MEKDFFARLGPSSRHQGVALKVPPAAREHATGMEPLLERTRDRKGVLVVLDHLTDPQNIGSIIRTAEALGCDGDRDAAGPRRRHNPGRGQGIRRAPPRTSRSSPSATSSCSSRPRKRPASGSSARPTGEPSRLRDCGGYRPAVVVIGSEGEGMRRLTEENCDLIVRIPLRAAYRR